MRFLQRIFGSKQQAKKIKDVSFDNVIQAIENIAKDNDCYMGCNGIIMIPMSLRLLVICDASFVDAPLLIDGACMYKHGLNEYLGVIPIKFSNNVYAIEYIEGEKYKR